MVLHFTRYAQLRRRDGTRLPQLKIAGLALEVAYKASRDKGCGAATRLVARAAQAPHVHGTACRLTRRVIARA